MGDWAIHMEAVREELSRLRSEISGLRSELRADLADQNAELRREIDRLIKSDREQEVKIAKLEVLSSVWGAVGGLVSAALAIALGLASKFLG